MSRISRLAAVAASLCCLALPAQAEFVRYSAHLSGPAESPPNDSPARGFGTVDYDNTAHLVRIAMSWAGLTSPTTAAHIHCCTAEPGEGVAIIAVTTPNLPGFPIGVTEGTYEALLDLNNPANFGASFLNIFGGGTRQGAEAALAAGLEEGRAYLNIHTQVFPAGEIRGFLHVPEPAVLALVGLGLLMTGWIRRVSGGAGSPRAALRPRIAPQRPSA